MEHLPSVNTCGAGFYKIKRLQMSIQRALGGVCLSSTHSRKLLTTLGFRLYYKPNRKQTSGGMAAAAWMRTMSRNLKEVRIHHCQTSKGSQGVRCDKESQLEGFFHIGIIQGFRREVLRRHKEAKSSFSIFDPRVQ